MTSQSKTLFAVILVLALIATGATWALERFSFYTLPSRGGVSTSIQVAVAPSVIDWAQEAAIDFNNSNSQITVTVIELDSKRLDSAFSADSPPDAWIPEATFVAQQNGSSAYNRSGESVASDSLLWAKPVSANYALDWQSVQDAAVNDRQFNVALPASNNTTAIATCLSAAQSYHQTTEIDFSLANDSGFKAWYRDIEAAIPNATDPLAQLLRRPPAIDVVMITNAQGHDLLDQFETAEPLFDVTLDYPYISRASWPELSNDEEAAKQTAVDRFFNTLIASESQSNLSAYGLEGANNSAETNARTIQALQWCWQ